MFQIIVTFYLSMFVYSVISKLEIVNGRNAKIEFKVHDIVKASGFGKICNTCDGSEKLLETNLHVISRTECEKDFSNLSNRSFCAMDLNEINKSTGK